MQKKKVGHIVFPKTRVNFRFISLLTVVFLIQQLSFASLHSAFFPGNDSPGIFRYSQKLPAPEETSHISMDIEVEVAEEDETHNPQDHSDCSLAAQYVIGRRIYTSFINSLYLHLELALHHQSDRPLFLLHHSWKAHLS